MVKISVIIPVFLGSEFLHECLSSVLAQTFSDFELILVCDEPTDETLKIIADFERRETRIKKIINTQRAGLVNSLNMGIASASGEYIARMDVDDICCPTRFKVQAEYLDLHPEVGVLGTHAQLINKNGNPIRVDPLPMLCKSIMFGLLFKNVLVHPSVIFRRDLFDNEAVYDPKYYLFEDYALWIKAIKTTEIRNLPDVLLKYRFYNSSVTQKNLLVQKNASFFLQKEEMERIICRSLTESENAALRWYVLSLREVADDEPFAFINLITTLYDVFKKKYSMSSQEEAEIRTITSDLLITVAALVSRGPILNTIKIWKKIFSLEKKFPILLIKKGYHHYQHLRARQID